MSYAYMSPTGKGKAKGSMSKGNRAPEVQGRSSEENYAPAAGFHVYTRPERNNDNEHNWEEIPRAGNDARGKGNRYSQHNDRHHHRDEQTGTHLNARHTRARAAEPRPSNVPTLDEHQYGSNSQPGYHEDQHYSPHGQSSNQYDEHQHGGHRHHEHHGHHDAQYHEAHADYVQDHEAHMRRAQPQPRHDHHGGHYGETHQEQQQYGHQQEQPMHEYEQQGERHDVPHYAIDHEPMMSPMNSQHCAYEGDSRYGSQYSPDSNTPPNHHMQFEAHVEQRFDQAYTPSGPAMSPSHQQMQFVMSPTNQPCGPAMSPSHQQMQFVMSPTNQPCGDFVQPMASPNHGQQMHFEPMVEPRQPMPPFQFSAGGPMLPQGLLPPPVIEHFDMPPQEIAPPPVQNFTFNPNGPMLSPMLSPTSQGAPQMPKMERSVTLTLEHVEPLTMDPALVSMGPVPQHPQATSGSGPGSIESSTRSGSEVNSDVHGIAVQILKQCVSPVAYSSPLEPEHAFNVQQSIQMQLASECIYMPQGQQTCTLVAISNASQSEPNSPRGRVKFGEYAAIYARTPSPEQWAAAQAQAAKCQPKPTENVSATSSVSEPSTTETERKLSSTVSECETPEEVAAPGPKAPRPPLPPNEFTDLLADLCPAAMGMVLERLVYAQVQTPRSVIELAQALYTRAGDANVARLCAEVVAAMASRLPCFPQEGGIVISLVQQVWTLCAEEFESIAGETPPDTSHGNVLLAAELYSRSLVPMSHAKDLLAALVFSREKPLDHAVNLSCHALLLAGPTLDRTEVGNKMVEIIVNRLKELKGGNYCRPTRQGLTDVIDLRQHRWIVKPKKERKEGSAKARARAASRARLLQQIGALAEAGPADAWALLRKDVDQAKALVELAVSSDERAEYALSIVIKLATSKPIHDEASSWPQDVEYAAARDVIKATLGSRCQVDNTIARDAIKAALV